MRDKSGGSCTTAPGVAVPAFERRSKRSRTRGIGAARTWLSVIWKTNPFYQLVEKADIYNVRLVEGEPVHRTGSPSVYCGTAAIVSP
jgi:hypothetical protein